MPQPTITLTPSVTAVRIGASSSTTSARIDQSSCSPSSSPPSPS